MKKMVGLFILCIVLLATTKNVSAEKKNPKVYDLIVNGINYNTVEETQTVKGVTYVPAKNTLILNNCNIKTSDKVDCQSFINYSGEEPLHIVIKGTNNIIGTGKFFSGLFTSFCTTDGFNGIIGNGDIVLEGGGTLNLKNIGEIVQSSYYESAVKCDVIIDGIKINSNGHVVSLPYGNLKIKNSKIVVRADIGLNLYSAFEVGTEAYRYYTNPSPYKDPDGNGKIEVIDSTIDIGQRKLFICKNLVTAENIYVGANDVDNKLSFSKICDNIGGVKVSNYKYGYMLITPKKLVKSVTKSFRPMEAQSAIKKLSVYGKDKITVKYEVGTGIISSCKLKQSEKNVLNNRVVQKGGKKLKKISKKKWKYTTTWYLNFKILPPLMKKAASKIAGTKTLAAISDLGKFVKVTSVYTVTGKGKISKSKYTYKFMVPSNLHSVAKDLFMLFAKKQLK